ncbi:MAG: hypothetical protein MR266_02545 [Erysipelotrichaceae bacterium]|nr:hypothetical protein [Erysipelotrichaceae bacterium]
MSNKLIRYYIINIIYTTIFLIGSTTYWYFNIKGIQDNLDDYNIHVVNEIKLDNLKQVSDKETNSLASYEVSLKNNTLDKQKMMVYIMKSNLNSNLTNNYIKYQINNYGINSLNMDGMIYLDNINSLEEKNIDLKVWISDSYLGDTNYQGYIVVNF